MSNGSPHAVFDLEYIVNYVTPGYATAVYVSASGVERIRTTAESHRRIAINEVVWTPVLTRRSSRVWQKAMPLIRNAGERASEDAIRSRRHFLQTVRNPRMVYHSSY